MGTGGRLVPFCFFVSKKFSPYSTVRTHPPSLIPSATCKKTVGIATFAGIPKLVHIQVQPAMWAFISLMHLYSSFGNYCPDYDHMHTLMTR